MFKGKKLLITGGTGSFGNAVLKGFIDSEIEEIRIFSRDEKKQHDMRGRYKNNKIKFYIGNVRDYDSVNTAMKGIDYVFHAAALKQVPSCEFFPLEATKTNVIGTSNVIKAATINNVKKVICLSTDKAAYPINAMGISKALMEKVAVAESRNIPKGGTVICITRYGNVMASRGSVIPLFFNQIKQGEQLTITDPKMTRFMMSLDEAVDLVLYAFNEGKQGDLFVQKSPACTIEDLAKAIQEICGEHKPVRVIGTRHGEKLYETLLTKEEFAKAENLEGYYRVPADNRDLNYGKYFDKGDKTLSEKEEYHSHNTYRLSVSEVKEKVLELSYLNDLDEYKK
jgi:UDP-glucose 4-epimerase